jgi:Glycosyl transferase family 2
VEVTVLMPCLNEARTVAGCVRQAAAFLARHGIDGEVVVADNGSTDGSPGLAAAAGARVVTVPKRGYGNALLGGIQAAQGQYVIMGDSDGSYDFGALMPFVDRLRGGADLVLGNRFRGGIQRGAMPALHRYLGNPVLTYAGRLFFGIRVGDLHCGLRGGRREALLALGLVTSGMEFASEMVVRSALAGQRVEEVPTTLAPDGRDRPSHLRSWPDGWRHLRFLLLTSPRWLFLIPSLALLAVGLAAGAVLLSAPMPLDRTAFGLNTFAVACGMIMIGFQGVLFGLCTYATMDGLRAGRDRVSRLLAAWSLERGLRVGAVAGVVALAGLAAELAGWGFPGPVGRPGGAAAARILLLFLAVLVVSGQLILGTFFLSVLRSRAARPAGAAADKDLVPAARPGEPDVGADADQSPSAPAQRLQA